MADGYTLFDTAIGRCGIAWGDAHVFAVFLPEQDDGATVARVRRQTGLAYPASPPPFVVEATSAIAEHLAGHEADLDSLPLAFERVGTFERAVYQATRRIGSGTTRTYGEIAREIGVPAGARAVGAALGRNPWPIVVPCHRVVAANGKLGGFTAPGGRSSKLRLLAIENATFGDGPTLFDRAG